MDWGHRLTLVARELIANPEAYDVLIEKLIAVWLLAGLQVM